MLTIEYRFFAYSEEKVIGLLAEAPGLGRGPGSGRWPVSRVSATHPNPSLAPQTAEPLAPVPPTLHQPVPWAPPEPPGSLTVVPLIADQRYYGKVTVGVSWGCGGAITDKPT